MTLLSRLYALAEKPIHFDESINGWFSLQMQQTGFYRYDPNNYHGPLYFYLLHGAEWMWGRSVEVLRCIPAVFSILSVLICPYPAVALLILFSPAFVFFGRSGIHEMPFVFFQLMAAWGVLRSFEKGDGKALALILCGLWGMLLLKETFVITLFCAGLAFLSLGWNFIRQFWRASYWQGAWTQMLTYLMIFLGVSFVLIYTGFFKNPVGFAHFFQAIMPWLKTGVEGMGHEKPFWYWFQVLAEAEPLVLLGVALAFVGAFSSQREIRFMSVFSLSQLLIYSLIPYKTVWCVLSLIWGF
ncbi:MAG: hypothetical protein AAGB31_10300 [Bdellovibrio sp.]